MEFGITILDYNARLRGSNYENLENLIDEQTQPDRFDLVCEMCDESKLNMDAVYHQSLSKAIYSKNYKLLDHMIGMLGKKILLTFQADPVKEYGLDIFENAWSKNGSLTEFKQMVNYLISNGADINIPAIFPDDEVDRGKIVTTFLDKMSVWNSSLSDTDREDVLTFLICAGAKQGFKTNGISRDFINHCPDDLNFYEFASIIPHISRLITGPVDLRPDLTEKGYEKIDKLLSRIKNGKFEFFKGSKLEESWLYKFPKDLSAKILTALECPSIDPKKIFEEKCQAKRKKITEKETLILNALLDPSSAIATLPREIVQLILEARIQSTKPRYWS